MSQHKDRPIRNPEEDIFGFSNLGNKIADAIDKTDNADGTVISIYGPWGSGKSSLINIVKSYLENKPSQNFKISNFNCWWIKGEESLVSEFFRHLYSVVDNTSNSDTRDLIVKFGSRIITNFAPAIGSISNLVLPGSSQFTTKIVKGIGDSIKQDENLDKLYEDLRGMLTKSYKKYLIIIDDIDRLLPQEMLLIFKLVKTVGHLPNFTYLLAYDRLVAEKIINSEYNSFDVSHFLEKIVQTGFDVPYASKSQISFKLRNFLIDLVGNSDIVSENHFKILYQTVILPGIITPRNLVRFCNTLSITWKTVKDEVDFMDFVTIEFFRLFYSEIYNFMKVNKHYLIIENINEEKYSLLKIHLNSLFEELNIENKDTEKSIKIGLSELFPQLNFDIEYNQFLEQVDNSINLLKNQRRICVQYHFDSYFQFTSNDEIVGNIKIKEFFNQIDNFECDRTFIQSLVDEGMMKSDPQKILYLIQEISNRSVGLEEKKVALILNEIFLCYDDIYKITDSNKDFHERHQIFKIFESFLYKSLSWFEVHERSEIVMKIMENKTDFNLCFDLARLVKGHIEQGLYDSDSNNQKLIVSKDDAEIIIAKAVKLIHSTYERGELIDQPNLFIILQFWDILQNRNDFFNTKKWFDDIIADNKTLVKFVELCIQNNFGFIPNITKHEKITSVQFNIKILATMTDLPKLESSIQSIIDSQDSGNSNLISLVKFAEILYEYQKSINN